MGLLEKEIQEIREMQKMYNAGKMTAKDVHVQIALYSQIEKRARLILNAHALMEKNKKSADRLMQTNLIGDGSAIDIGNPGCEKIMCMQKGNDIITRDQCLDFSGDIKNHEECESCDHFSTTRKVILSK